MNTASEINDLLVASLQPIRLDVINESHMHNVPEGSESHFKLLVVSDAFEGQSLIARHRSVNKVLAEVLKNKIHALSMHTYTADEWDQKGGDIPASPPCLGGKASEASETHG